MAGSKRRGVALAEHFWTKVDVREPQSCWRWKGGRIYGYGQFWNGRVHVRAHRFAYSLIHGALLPDQILCHSCDNPLCCNPDHLVLGDYASNNRDRVEKGRSARGVKIGTAKLTEDQVRFIRAMYRRGNGGELARRFGVSPQTIYAVVRGSVWSHVEERE